MLQSSVLQFHNPTHRNTGVSDPRSHHITRRVVVWGIFRHGLCIPHAKLNKELLKMLYFHSRGVGQFLGEGGETQIDGDTLTPVRQADKAGAYRHAFITEHAY